MYLPVVSNPSDVTWTPAAKGDPANALSTPPVPIRNPEMVESERFAT